MSDVGVLDAHGLLQSLTTSSKHGALSIKAQNRGLQGPKDGNNKYRFVVFSLFFNVIMGVLGGLNFPKWLINNIRLCVLFACC